MRATQRKGRAPSPAEEQTPHKAARVSLAEDISERRLRTEVQALLAGVDLADTTVGQLRRALEVRLGLTAGALCTGKRLQRLVSRSMQHEVMKKSERSQDCERVVKALVDFEDYPAAARQMLIDGLPHALAHPVAPGGAALHAHQARLLDIARDALRDARVRAAGAHVRCEASVFEAEAELARWEVDSEAAANARAEASERVQAAESALMAAEQEVAASQRQLDEAEAAALRSREAAVAAANGRSRAVSVRDGAFALLCRGTWTEEPARDAALQEVMQFLTASNIEDVLIAAAPATLRQPPGQRGTFDALVAARIEAAISERIGAADAQPVARSELAVEASRLGAAALLSVAQSRAANQAAAVAAAREAAMAAAEAARAVKADTSRRRAAVGEQRAELARLEAKLQELDDLLALLGRLIAGPEPLGGAPGDHVGSEPCGPTNGDVGAAGAEVGALERISPCSHDCRQEATAASKLEAMAIAMCSPRRVATPMAA